MENVQKALVMAGSVFMFVIALSVAAFSYTIVTDIIDSILTSSDRNARTAEYFIQNTQDTTRYSTREEVIMTILSMKDSSFSASEVIVDGFKFKKDSFNTITGRDSIESNLKTKVTAQKYKITYNMSNKKEPIVIFTSL